MTTEAQKRTSRKYDLEKIENIRLRVPIGKKALVKECAERNYESINSMINRLLDKEIERVLHKK